MQCILHGLCAGRGLFQAYQIRTKHWLSAYRAFMEAMRNAGVLESSKGLDSASMASTVRVIEWQNPGARRPLAETKEQLGGFHIINVPDLDAAISWAARSPTALHVVVEVRPIMEVPPSEWRY